MHSTTPRSITVTWDEIECIERNGVITGYEVRFRRQGETGTIDGQQVGRTFMASGLRPFTNYEFEVAGVNDRGSGLFTGVIPISTDEDGRL